MCLLSSIQIWLVCRANSRVGTIIIAVWKHTHDVHHIQYLINIKHVLHQISRYNVSSPDLALYSAHRISNRHMLHQISRYNVLSPDLELYFDCNRFFPAVEWHKHQSFRFRFLHVPTHLFQLVLSVYWPLEQAMVSPNPSQICPSRVHDVNNSLQTRVLLCRWHPTKYEVDDKLKDTRIDSRERKRMKRILTAVRTRVSFGGNFKLFFQPWSSLHIQSYVVWM